MDCFSSANKRRHDYFLKIIQQRCFDQKNTHKILLIGTGESGKSTFVKQLKLLSSTNQTFPETYRDKFIPEIQRNIVQSLSNILNFMLLEDISFKSNNSILPNLRQTICSICTEIENMPQVISEYAASPNSSDRKEFYDMCYNLWEDENVKLTQQRGNEFQQIDCAVHFLDKINTIRNPDYRPSDVDILMCRTKTLGIHTESILYNNIQFELVDVGGQRDQRAKWIEAMTDGITAVIFLTDVSAYDMCLSEDHSINRLRESIHLLGQVWTKSLLKDKSIILFLNKQDRLEQKVRSHKNPINNYFADYNEEKVVFTIDLLIELINAKVKKIKKENEIWDKYFAYFLPSYRLKQDSDALHSEANSSLDKATEEVQIMSEYGQIQSLLTKAFNENLINNWTLEGRDKSIVIRNLMKRDDFTSFFDHLIDIPLYQVVTITNFIKNLFLNECEQTKTRRIYPYPTTAIDKRNVNRVFESCRDILQGKALTEIIL